MIDAASIRRFAPNARPELTQAIAANWHHAESAEIATSRRVQHFMTQIAHETNGLARLDENMNYSAARLVEVFPRRVTPAQARILAGNPKAIANHVYGGRLGNHLPNDGWDYRGSGFIQLTGRENFRKRGAEIGMPLEENPELCREPGPGFLAAVAYWKVAGCNDPAERDDVRGVRKRINPALAGLAECKVWLAKAKRVFTDGARAFEPNAAASELEAVGEMLGTLGYAEGVRSADPDMLLRSFQEARGLNATGRVDDATLDAVIEEMEQFDGGSAALPPGSGSVASRSAELLVIGLVGVASGFLLAEALGRGGEKPLARGGGRDSTTRGASSAVQSESTAAQAVRLLGLLRRLPEAARSEFYDEQIASILNELARRATSSRGSDSLTDWLQVQAAADGLAAEGLGEVTLELYQTRRAAFDAAMAQLSLEQQLALKALTEEFEPASSSRALPPAFPTFDLEANARSVPRVLASFDGTSVFTSRRGFPAIEGILAIHAADGLGEVVFQATSGGGARDFRATNGPLPPGIYRVSNHRPNRTTVGMVAHGVGYSFDLDPTDGTQVFGRSLFRIHPDGPSRGTNGCIGVEGNAATLRACEARIAAGLRAGGPFRIIVRH
ncbi:hypothetical protein [Paracoccus niistensis]|uniref:Uncharacterized protein n=1 Tax=Paracoccus niistensis TaxID=632935 RepID=A0ABV6I8I1_9RHOB